MVSNTEERGLGGKTIQYQIDAVTTPLYQCGQRDGVIVAYQAYLLIEETLIIGK